jgi:hypothetical protein
LKESIFAEIKSAEYDSVHLSNGGSVEKTQQMANHSDPRTTKLCDCSRDEFSLDEVERISV